MSGVMRGIAVACFCGFIGCDQPVRLDEVGQSNDAGRQRDIQAANEIATQRDPVEEEIVRFVELRLRGNSAEEWSKFLTRIREGKYSNSELERIIRSEKLIDAPVVKAVAMRQYVLGGGTKGLDRAQVVEKLGPPSMESADELVYSYDEGFYVWEWIFVLRDGKVEKVLAR